MSETPWYVKHSKTPKGAYGGNPFTPRAESNPENRRGVMLHHHTTYDDTTLQRSIAEGLAILREAPERVVLVGGDLPDGSRDYYHVGWNKDEHTYEVIQEGRRKRTQCHGLLQVMNYLDSKFEGAGPICAILIYVKNSPFNISEKSRPGFIGA